MAHNLNFNAQTGKYSFFSVKQNAWHGLGQIVTEYPTSAQAIAFAGLDFSVAKLPNRQELPSGKILTSASSYFTYREHTETILGDKVGKDYHIVQNADAFAFFDAIVSGSDGILYETAGAIGNGERIFITAKLPGYIRVGNGDDVTEKYLFLTTSHDGSGSITAAFTPIRVVCQNTLNAALANLSNVVRIRHTANARQRLADAHKVMGIADRMASQLEDIFNQWAATPVTDAQVKKLVQLALCPNRETLEALRKGADDELSTVFKNTCEDAFAYAMTSETQQMATTKGTLFGAYNCITGYFQNVRTYKSNEDKLKSIFLGGTAQQRGQKAFELCAGFVKDGNAVFALN